MNTWKDYITNKYLNWRKNKIGQEGSAARFANEIGITPQLLNEWMNRDKVPTDPKYIEKLRDYFGEEIFAFLTILPYEIDKDLKTLLSHWPQINPNLRHKFASDALKDILKTEKIQTDIDAERRMDWEEGNQPEFEREDFEER